ncbi:MAG: hypothetical protein R3220_00770 [Balneolaceae bacterium]|nr:hypothetical protein [Balneolaceae bacterium]
MNFYFDENITPQIARALAILQEPLQHEHIKILNIRDEFGRGVADEQWIPEVGKQEGIVITQDLNIHRTRQQRELYRRFKIGVVFFKPPKKTGYGYWTMIEKIIEAWPDIKKVAKRERTPFAYVIRPRSKRLEEL